MRSLGSFLAALVSLAAGPVLAMPSERTAVWEWHDVPRVVAIGDLHGGYSKLVQLLRGAVLVDDELRWIGSETHLIVAGDMLDRGLGERPLLDLLRRLQDEAVASGGRVHVLLGNHEVMSLLRDVRYVNPRSYRDFADLEHEADREAAWEVFLESGAWGKGDTRHPRQAFEEGYPPGYFGRLRALDPDGEYGAWLLSQPVIVKVNGVAYVHGGLTEDFASLGVDGLNRLVADQLARHLEERQRLEEAGVVDLTMDFVELYQAVEEALGNRRKKLPPKLTRAAEAFLESAAHPVLGGEGPLWYRGNSWEDERIESDRLERSLELVGADGLVVAHSYTGGNRITSRFHGKLLRLDHGILKSQTPLALVRDRGETLVLDAATRDLSPPVRETPNGRGEPPRMDEVSEDELEAFLADAPVAESRELGRGSTRPLLVVLERGSERQRGLWKDVETSDDRYQHEVAAYRLARLLGLRMVPPTVVRELDGKKGSLQWWVEGAVDREAAEDYGLVLCQSEAEAVELGVVPVFDALIGNFDRRPSDVLCLLNGEQVFVIDHSRAFSTSSELPPGVPEKLELDPDLEAALRALDPRSLEEELDELLGERQVRALLERRDRILERAKRG